jgi:hypothetical protein
MLHGKNDVPDVEISAYVALLGHVSKHPAVAAERFLGSLGLVWARWVL